MHPNARMSLLDIHRDQHARAEMAAKLAADANDLATALMACTAAVRRAAQTTRRVITDNLEGYSTCAELDTAEQAANAALLALAHVATDVMRSIADEQNERLSTVFIADFTEELLQFPSA